MVTKKKKPTPKKSTKKVAKTSTYKVASRGRGLTPPQNGNICGRLAYEGHTLTVNMTSGECEGITLKIFNNGSEIQCFWDGTQWVCNSDIIISKD